MPETSRENRRRNAVAIIAVIVLMLIFFMPVFRRHETGILTGVSLTYRVIIWPMPDGEQLVRLYLFPNNFHTMDYYIKIGGPDAGRI